MSAFGRPLSRRTVWVFAGVALVAIAALVVLGYHAAFSSYFEFDDEGELLVYLRDYAAGTHLYNSMYSEYGPGYFVLITPFFDLFGLELNHDNGRMLALALWLAASGLCGIALFRLSGSAVLGIGGLLLSFVVLHALGGTQLHPVTPLSFLLAGMVCAAALLLPGRPGAAMGAIGAITAAILLIKVNVGGFAVAPVVLAFAATVPQLRQSRALFAAVAAAVVLLPFALLSAQLDHRWAVEFALVIATGSAAVVVMALRPLPAPGVPLRDAWWAAGGFALAALVILGAVIAHGSTPGGLFRGIVTNPLYASTAYLLPPPSRLFAPLIGAAGLGAALLVRYRRPSEPARRWLPAARIAAGFGIWTAIASLPADRYARGDGTAIALGVAASLAWVAAVPRQGETSPWSAFVRVLVAELAVLQLLHIYPVAGYQLATGSLVLVIAGGICIADGLGELRREWVRALPFVRVAAIAAFAALAIWASGPLRDDQGAYADNPPSGLHGAERLHIPSIQGDGLRRVAGELHNRCRTFVSLPGLNSLYLWSGLQPPTHLNPGDWTFILTANDQRRVLDQVRRRPGLCLVSYPSMQSFWENGEPVPRRPLYEWFRRNFRPTEQIHGYELMIPGPRS